jgi:OmpA-OmpF porin, OOP family
MVKLHDYPGGCMKMKWVFASTALVVLALPATAQPPTVLKDSEITESALIEGLSPQIAPPAGEGGVRMRSIKVQRDQSGEAQKAPSVSLLITFHTNSAKLTPGAKRSLDVVGAALNRDKLANYSFDIEGHADPRGGYEFNRRLSQARAETVKEYLVRYHDIDEDRLSAIGKGDRELLDKDNPIAPENRRVTFMTKLK